MAAESMARLNEVVEGYLAFIRKWHGVKAERLDTLVFPSRCLTVVDGGTKKFKMSLSVRIGDKRWDIYGDSVEMVAGEFADKLYEKGLLGGFSKHKDGDAVDFADLLTKEEVDYTIFPSMMIQE